LDLGSSLSRPAWLERDLSLPFDHLSGDEFEVFCYLLLRREHPSEDIVYYGKTADLGRDIIRRREDGNVELIQCKRYGGNVGKGDVRIELAKLFTNLFKEVIPERPTRISFYVARDLTSPARGLLAREQWVEAAEQALKGHLKKAPSPDLLSFARAWWPAEGIYAEPGIRLTDRAECYPELIEKFFGIKKVVSGSVPDIAGEVEKLLAERETQPSSNRRSGNTWEDFFTATSQGETASRYLNDWPGLTPEARFEPPREFSAIQDSVNSRPLTILIGPPAAGKTFIAIQVLWAAFQKGLQVLWIAPTMFRPTDGPIPAERGLPDMRQRIESLTTKLGVKRFRAPLDRHEFITVNLEPGNIVYIEDPFGKRDEEFEYSLHTYKFFDLDECVAAISDEAGRSGCHILLSSREGLFDRWQTEREKAGLPPIPAKLIRISGESYDYQQLEKLATHLAQARGFEHPEDVAVEICYQVEFPYEIESILRALPRDAVGKQVEAEVAKYRGGLKSALRKTLVADNEQEMLFLVVLASRCTDPKTHYLRLHQALDLLGDAEGSLDRAVERYSAFVVRRPAFRLGNYGPDADEVFSPSHPVVDEAIMEYLRASAASSSSFLERLACALPEDALDRKSAHSGTDIALQLLFLGVGCRPGQAQEAILSVLLERGGLSLHHVRGLMRLWSATSPTFKDRLLAYLESGLHETAGDTRLLLVEAASNLTFAELPSEGAWKVTRLLFRKEVFKSSNGRGMYTWESPWSYLFEHLEEAPAYILRPLERIVVERPDLFVYVMGEVAVAHWAKLPESHKAAFFADSSLKSLRVQEVALQGIARYWEKAPRELRDLFVDQAASKDPAIRVAATTAAWIYGGSGEPVLEKVLLDSASDPDVKVPLEIMHSLGDEERDRRFARVFFERADANLAAEMLFDLIGSSAEPLPQWKLDLARECLVKGGDHAWSIVGLLHFGGGEAVTNPLHNWRDEITEEPEPIRLGALWAYGRSAGKSPKLDPDKVISSIKGMRNPYRSLALAYLSAQVKGLPGHMQEFIRELETAADEEGEAVRIGKEKRGSSEGNNPWLLLSLIEEAGA